MEETGFLVLLFALRCVLPLALTIGLGYLMNRMVNRWEHEAAEQAKIKPVGAQEKRPSSPQPCWTLIGCDPARRAGCPAAQQRSKPCWIARLATDGVLPAACPTCPVYQLAHA